MIFFTSAVSMLWTASRPITGSAEVFSVESLSSTLGRLRARLRKAKQRQRTETHFAEAAAKGEAEDPGLCEAAFTVTRDLQIEARAIGIHAGCLHLCNLQARQPADQMRHICTAILPATLPPASLLNLCEVSVTHTKWARGPEEVLMTKHRTNYWVRGCHSAHRRRNRLHHAVVLALDQWHDVIQRPHG